MKARIGMVSQWYDPERGSAAQPGVIARHLRGAGHAIDVVTGFPNYPSGRVYEGYRMRPYQREQRSGVTVHRVPLYPSHDAQAVRRSLTYLSFSAAAALVSARALRHAQSVLVYSSPATAAVPALLLRILRGTPYVVHVHDLWPDSVLHSGFLPRRRIGAIAERTLHAYCNLVYRHAAAVAVTSPSMATAIRARGVPQSKIRFIPNWADEDVFRPVPRDLTLQDRLGLRSDATTVMYAGNIGEYQDLGTVVNAAARLRNRSDVQFVLVGDGVERASLEERCHREGLDNVIFTGPQPVEEMPGLLALGDLHLVTLRDLPLFRMTLPSKLVSTLSSGRPVLAALAGDGAALVTDSGAGEVVNPGRADELAAAVERFVALDQVERDRRGAAGRSYYQNNLGRVHVGRVLSELLDEVASSTRASVRPAA